jgi:hypothetical protein
VADGDKQEFKKIIKAMRDHIFPLITGHKYGAAQTVVFSNYLQDPPIFVSCQPPPIHVTS